MRKALEWAHVALVSLALVTFPVLGCQSPPPMDPEAQAQHAQLLAERDAALQRADEAAQELQAAIAAGDELRAQLAAEAGEQALTEANAAELEAAQLEVREGEQFVGGFFDMLGQFVPGSETLKGMAVPLIASLWFPRPRELYLKALKGVGESLVHLNPLGSKMAPGDAVVSLVKAFRDAGAAVGLKHTTDDPDQLMKNAKSLAAKRDLQKLQKVPEPATS